MFYPDNIPLEFNLATVTEAIRRPLFKADSYSSRSWIKEIWGYFDEDHKFSAKLTCQSKLLQAYDALPEEQHEALKKELHRRFLLIDVLPASVKSSIWPSRSSPHYKGETALKMRSFFRVDVFGKLLKK